MYVGIALDLPEQSPVEKELGRKGTMPGRQEILTLTMQIVSPQAVRKGEGQTTFRQYINVKSTGDSIFKTLREFALTRERPIIAHHLKVIVIGDKLIRKYGLDQLLNMFLKDNDIRPSTLIFVSKGNAAETLAGHGSEDIPSFRVAGLLRNRFRNMKILPPVTLIKVQGKMVQPSSFLLQKVVSADNDLKLSGAAVIDGKTLKLRGFLNEDELGAVSIITSETRGGYIKTSIDGQPLTYEVTSIKRKIKPHYEKGAVSFAIDVQTKGRLMEDWAEPDKPLTNTRRNELEEAVKREITQSVGKTMRKLQQDYRTDAVGFGKRMEIVYPKLWKTLKKDWDETFAEADVEVNVNAEIVDIGSSM
jgi:spore germination protein